MSGVAVTLLLLVVMTVAGVYQQRRHLRYLAMIPIRVHVNGTRGKSSVTRLIAAGLRAGGLKTVGKTTGTKPRFIYPDGSEVPVVRAGAANIIEQVRIVRRAAELGAQVLVTECMGVKPELQSLLEDRMIRSTHSVITNARADHLDEMGPTVKDVARSLSRTISYGGQFFTAEREHLEILRDVAVERGTGVHVSLPGSIDPHVLAQFSYFEHAENVALALAVCRWFGIETEDALGGMIAATPDPGALRVFQLDVFGRHITFVNAFAMNDPDSYQLVWERLAHWFPPAAVRVIIVNCRKDRIQRAEQLGTLIGLGLPADLYLISGEGTGAVYQKARRLGVPRARMEDLGGRDAAYIFERVLSHSDGKPVAVYGVGNIVGLGEEIVDYFRSRGEEIVYRSAT